MKRRIRIRKNVKRVSKRQTAWSRTETFTKILRINLSLKNIHIQMHNSYDEYLFMLSNFQILIERALKINALGTAVLLYFERYKIIVASIT